MGGEDNFSRSRRSSKVVEVKLDSDQKDDIDDGSVGKEGVEESGERMGGENGDEKGGEDGGAA